MMRYEILKKKPEIFLRLFGVKVAEFEKIREKAAPLWIEEIIGKYAGPGRLFKRDLSEMILILLLYYRRYVTQEFVGMLFGLHKSHVCRIIKRLEPIFPRITPLPRRDKLSPEEIKDLRRHGEPN